MTASPNIRVYGRMRTIYLELFRDMVPARVVYWQLRADYHPSEVDPANAPVQLNRVGILRELLRRHHTAVEINEPAMVDRWGFLLLAVLAVRLRSLVARRPSTIAAYCMANADPALEVQARRHLPAGASRGLTKAMMTLLVRSCDRLSFATRPSMELYEEYVGKTTVQSRSRLFVAIPSACGCLADATEPRDPTQVLFVGGFVERKGIHPMMAAWEVLLARRPDARLVIIGMGRLEGEVKAWASGLPSVTVHVDPPRAEIHRAMRTSGSLLLLSQRAGFWKEQIGQPIQEALGHGCEIVTTSDTGIADWLTEHGHPVLDLDAGPDAVAEAIEQTIERAERRKGTLADLPRDDQRIVADRWMMTGSEQLAADA
jgi:glycosyltransferase involved in cell wall biosynthesis